MQVDYISGDASWSAAIPASLRGRLHFRPPSPQRRMGHHALRARHPNTWRHTQPADAAILAQADTVRWIRGAPTGLVQAVPLPRVL